LLIPDALLEFRYKSCFFEALHMPFFIVLAWRALWWYFAMGNIGLVALSFDLGFRMNDFLFLVIHG
jgi:hypothetical protein